MNENKLDNFICSKQKNKILLTEYYNELRDRQTSKGYNSKIEEIAKARDFKVETLLNEGWVYVDKEEEMLLPRYLDSMQELGIISPNNKRPIFSKRFLIPIRDCDGLILNFVGYSREADERYVYGTAPYYRRREDMYGLENIEYAYEVGWGILVEGITDTIRLHELGFRNSFGNCGTHGSTSTMERLNRCRYGIIKIPDRDIAGREALKRWETFKSVVLFTSIIYKDVDEMCRNSLDNKNIVVANIEKLSNWLKQSEHKGIDKTVVEVTM